MAALADELQETQDRLFLRERAAVISAAPERRSENLLRMKEDNDSAEPAASSVAA